MADEVRVAIAGDADLVTARAEARAMAERLGFPRPDPTLIATAISEIARNIVVHVGRGEIVLKPFEDARPLRPRRDRATDEGPGIRDVEAALRDDYSGRRRPRPRASRRAAAHGRVRDRLGRRDGHDRDDEEVAVPRRARAPARGAPPACAERAAREPVEWARGHAGAGAARRRSGDLAVVDAPAGGRARGRDRRPRARRRGRPRRPAGRRGRPRERPVPTSVLLVERCHVALRGTRGAAISLAFVSPPTAG